MKPLLLHHHVTHESAHDTLKICLLKKKNLFVTEVASVSMCYCQFSVGVSTCSLWGREYLWLLWIPQGLAQCQAYRRHLKTYLFNLVYGLQILAKVKPWNKALIFFRRYLFLKVACNNFSSITDSKVGPDLYKHCRGALWGKMRRLGATHVLTQNLPRYLCVLDSVFL